jgi:hypothetical protein
MLIIAYDIITDMHKQYLTNEEDIEFPKVSSAKQMPEISLELNT